MLLPILTVGMACTHDFEPCSLPNSPVSPSPTIFIPFPSNSPLIPPSPLQLYHCPHSQQSSLCGLGNRNPNTHRHGIASHFTLLHCIALHCTVLHCIALHCTALHCIALYFTALHCITLHCTALHCIALHCIALHCNTLQYTALQCTLFI